MKALNRDGNFAFDINANAATFGFDQADYARHVTQVRTGKVQSWTPPAADSTSDSRMPTPPDGKEYDFNYAIHLHGPDIELFPDATDAWEHTKDLDPRIGMCLDVGHDLRNGCDPVADLKKYHSRVFDMHIKDVTEASKAGKGIEIGRGKIDFPALVRMMREVTYTGVCSLEFEKDMKDPFLGIAESIGYFKAVSDLA